MQQRGGVAQGAAAFHKKDSTWRQVPGRASESPQARKAYDLVRSLVAKYPTEASLKAAGFQLAKGSTNHYDVSAQKLFSVDGVKLAHLVVKDGMVAQAQFDSSARNASDPPPSWSGVQWHYHDHGNASWMFHVSAGKPIDQAFIEEHAH